MTPVGHLLAPVSVAIRFGLSLAVKRLFFVVLTRSQAVKKWALATDPLVISTKHWGGGIRINTHAHTRKHTFHQYVEALYT